MVDVDTAVSNRDWQEQTLAAQCIYFESRELT